MYRKMLAHPLAIANPIHTHTGYVVLLTLLCVFFAVTNSFADTLPVPNKQIILTVKGQIEHQNTNTQARKVHFDRAMLQGLPQRRIATTTRWTRGKQVFEGVPIQDLMNYVGATGKKLKAVALDGYTTPVMKMADLSKYGVILALKKNGKPLKIRDKGPIWMMYPMDEHPELKNDVLTQYKLIWHLRTIIVE